MSIEDQIEIKSSVEYESAFDPFGYVKQLATEDSVMQWIWKPTTAKMRYKPSKRLIILKIQNRTSRNV